jgi:hypothetical protein
VKEGLIHNHRDFRWYWAGQTISLLGTEVTATAMLLEFGEGGAPTSRIRPSRLGKIPTTSVRRLISRFNRSCGLVDQICHQHSRGNAMNFEQVSRAWARCAAALGSLVSSAVTIRSNWAATSTASSWSKMVRAMVATHRAWLLGTWVSRFHR